MKPLENIIVLDLTRVLAGPYCTMILRELGARIIKIEHPDTGDDSRHFGPFKNDVSAYFVSINREKESLTLNLKNPKAQEILKELVKKVDILVENFRPGTMEKFEVGFDVLEKINPKLIYAASSGFGHTGPLSTKPAYDMIVQAMGGIMSITGWPDGPPTRVGSSIGDITAALFTAIGICSALYQRTLSGKGQKIDVAMLDCQLAILENALARYFIEGKSPTPLGTRHPTITPFQAFKTKDSYLIVAVGNDKLWEIFCDALNLNEFKNNPKFKTNKLRCDNYDELAGKLKEIFTQKTTAQWEELFHKVHIPCTPIAKIEDVVKNPQLIERAMLVEVDDPVMGKMKLAGNPIKMTTITENGKRKKAPCLGEHTQSVLEEFLGYDYNEIAKLKEEGVI